MSSAPLPKADMRSRRLARALCARRRHSSLPLAIADILAVVRPRERGRHSLSSPDRAAGPPWGKSECAVPVFQVARYRCLSLGHSSVVAIVDDCSSHPTEHRLNDIQKLRLCGQGQYLDVRRLVVPGPTIEKFDAVEELFG